jgi:hypothetical protein
VRNHRRPLIANAFYLAFGISVQFHNARRGCVCARRCLNWLFIGQDLAEVSRFRSGQKGKLPCYAKRISRSCWRFASRFAVSSAGVKTRRKLPV